MLFTVENEHLKLTVDTLGAQMQSILSSDGCEYLWQGDPKYWEQKAPVLFPFIARLMGKTYAHNGKEYAMGIHGFAAGTQFVPDYNGADTLTMTLTSNEATKAVYPFDFELKIAYRLVGKTVQVIQQVTNKGEDVMHFALGGHPGFRVPLEEGQAFEDYYLEFSHPCAPDLIGFTPDNVLLSGVNRPYPLEDGKRISLYHELFDGDALIMQNAAREVALRSRTSSRSVTVAYPQMPYIGFWKRDHSDAPYVCIEPWSSLPGREGITEEISCRSDFIHLAPGKVWENTWTITVSEG